MQCNLRSFLGYEEQCKCLPNLNYGSESVFIAFHILKMNLRYMDVWLTGAKVKFYLRYCIEYVTNLLHLVG